VGTREQACSWLEKKWKIIEKLAANTENQRSFIPQRKMVGLKRLLRERDALLRELAGVDEELMNDPNWKIMPDLAVIMQEVAVKQQEILQCSIQTLQQAVAEKNCIAAELKKSRVGRQVNNQYMNPWLSLARGRRINEKG